MAYSFQIPSAWYPNACEYGNAAVVNNGRRGGGTPMFTRAANDGTGFREERVPMATRGERRRQAIRA